MVQQKLIISKDITYELKRVPHTAGGHQSEKNHSFRYFFTFTSKKRNSAIYCEFQSIKRKSQNFAFPCIFLSPSVYSRIELHIFYIRRCSKTKSYSRSSEFHIPQNLAKYEIIRIYHQDRMRMHTYYILTRNSHAERRLISPGPFVFSFNVNCIILSRNLVPKI